MEYYVYVIYSPGSDKYYTGYTSDPESRLMEHNLGATTSTRNGRHWREASHKVAIFE
jgi:predicted GIY-YIG superfamily endonuclease